MYTIEFSVMNVNPFFCECSLAVFPNVNFECQHINFTAYKSCMEKLPCQIIYLIKRFRFVNKGLDLKYFFHITVPIIGQSQVKCRIKVPVLGHWKN